MQQRVNVTYSVPLEDLSEEVRRLIERAYHNLSIVTDHMQGFKEPLSIESFNKIDGVRMRLAGIDATLADINNIITSYLDYSVHSIQQERSQMPIEGTPLPAQDEEKMGEALDALQEKLAFFKEQAVPHEVAD